VNGGDGRQVRMLVALFPPAWRVRYADEFAALMAEIGTGAWATLDVLAAAQGGWLRPPAPIARRARRHVPVVALLAAPVVLPLASLVVAAASTVWARSSAPPGAGVAAPVFVLLAAFGVATAAGCGAGPALALAQSGPNGPVRLTVALAASACATAAMAVASIVSGAYQVARADAASAGLAVYALGMATALAVAAVSGVRGLRAAHLNRRSACAG
jgi:hypothetical protein